MTSAPRWLFPAILFDVLFMDQLTKWVVQKHIPLYGFKPVWPVLNLVHVQNTGASFGMFQDSNRAFIVLSVLILVFLAVMHKKLAADGPLTTAGLACLWGGALGNLIDRIRVGAVVDFLDFFWGPRHWPAFNVADSAITVGVTLMFLESLLHGRQSKQENVPR